MFKMSLLAATALLALSAAPAGAACLDDVAQLRQRLDQLQAAEQQPGDGETVQMEMAGGREARMTVDDAESGTQPQENWFGSPPSLDGAEEQLRNAREMAEAGDEQGCMEHTKQAEQIITSLEDQLQ